jgi:hypothetical protein
VKKFLLGVPLLLAGLACALVLPPAARADVPGLQVAPLQYEDTLHPGHVENGFIDVSNPGDAPIDIVSSVKGFRQTGTNGDLQFFDDPDLSAAITVGLDHFTLGPREAIRVVFSVDPAKLPQGGIYAAVFFRTQPPDQTSSRSYVAQSANVGTLLMLNNGASTTHYGQVTALKVPFWQFGYGLTGSLTYQNTDHTARPVGFKPALETRVLLPWGKAPKLSTGLVLPGSTRTFALNRPGSYIGLLPVIVTDTDTHRTVVTWVFACTGLYGYLTLFLLVLLVTLEAWRLIHHQPFIPTPLKRAPSRLCRWLKSQLHRLRRRSKAPKPSLDGLSRKS